MEILSARILEDEPSQNRVEVEKELLKKAEEEAKLQTQPPTEAPPPSTEIELDNDKVLSHINTKFNKGYASIDELFIPQVVEKEVELPEDVATFYKFKKETGRGLEDFMKIQRDFAKENPDTLLAEYISSQNPEFNAEDVADEIKNRFGYDEALDDEETIKRQQRAKKKELSKAIAHFESQKEQYKAPTVSEVQNVPDTEKEMYESWKQEVSIRNDQVQKNKLASEVFIKKTNELFTNDFKGFDFKVGDKTYNLKPNDTEKTKQAQMDIASFINSHVDESGHLKDASLWHKALFVAMNPDLFAQHFIEQGKADAISEQAIRDKNINMGTVRNAPELTSQGGMKARMLDDPDAGKQRIPSNTRK